MMSEKQEPARSKVEHWVFGVGVGQKQEQK